MTFEEAKEVFINRGFVNGIYDGDKWRESVVIISKWLEQEPCEDCCNGNQIEKAKLCQKSYLAGMEHKQEPCEDAISRAELLKAMDTYDKFGYTETGCFVREPKNDYVPYVHYEDMVNCVKGMPSVTPQETRWIPVSEKKPNKGGEYLLWGKIDESEEEDYCFIGDYHEFDEVFGTEISNYDPKTLGFIDTEIEEYYSVVAWMPLPQPYREVEE